MIAKRQGRFIRLALAAGFCWASVLFLPGSLLATDSFVLGTGNGNAGATGVEVPLTATHDQGMQGFSLSISYDPLKVTMTGLTFDGTAVALVAPGGIPDYIGLTIDAPTGTAVAGVIFGFDPVAPLNQLPQIPASPDTPNTLANLIFDIDASVLPGDVPISFDDGLGSPPVNNVYSNDGQSYAPNLVDGVISVNNLHRFYFDPMLAVPGGSVSAVVRYDHEDPMTGFVISLSWDSAKLSIQPPPITEGWWLGTDLEIALAPDTIEYFDMKNVPATPQPGVGYLALIAIFDFTGPFNAQQVPVGSGQSLVRVNFDVANNPGLIGVDTPIQFENEISPAPPPGGLIPPPTVNLAVTDTSAGILPIQEDGVVSIVDLPSFERGNANGDTAVNLADAIFLLQYLFTSGPNPGCFDAADVTDDGSIDISDAIRIINYLFTDGAPPESPFPGCGLDGTPDSFPECTTSVGSCP